MDWYLICCFVILKTAVSSCYYIILSFVTSSKARKLSTIRTNTHTHASASFSSCSAIQGGKKTPECWRVPHVFGSYWHWGESSFQTPPPQPNQVTVNFPAVSEQAATSLGQIGLMARLCLPFAVIYSCVYSSCRYPLRSSVPPSFPVPLPAGQRGNNVLLHQVWYAPTISSVWVFVCVSNRKEY